MAMSLPAEDWIKDGKEFRRIPREAQERWCLSVDLGQASDFTAVALIHHQVVPLDGWDHSPLEQPRVILRQRVDERFTVRHLERLSLGLPYTEQVGIVAEMLTRHPLRDMGCDLVLDGSGVGRPVADMFESAGLRPVQIYITSGFEVERKTQRVFTVPKSILISGLNTAMHQEHLKIHTDLAEAGPLREELHDLRRSVTAAGRVTFAARGSRHDDLVLSLAIGVWWLSRPSQRPSIGFVQGLY